MAKVTVSDYIREIEVFFTFDYSYECPRVDDRDFRGPEFVIDDTPDYTYEAESVEFNHVINTWLDEEIEGLRVKMTNRKHLLDLATEAAMEQEDDWWYESADRWRDE